MNDIKSANGTWECYACGKILPHTAFAWIVVDGDTGQEVEVGSDCGKKTRAAGEEGYMPEQNPVHLYTRKNYEKMMGVEEDE